MILFVYHQDIIIGNDIHYAVCVLAQRENFINFTKKKKPFREVIPEH